MPYLPGNCELSRGNGKWTVFDRTALDARRPEPARQGSRSYRSEIRVDLHSEESRLIVEKCQRRVPELHLCEPAEHNRPKQLALIQHRPKAQVAPLRRPPPHAPQSWPLTDP